MLGIISSITSSILKKKCQISFFFDEIYKKGGTLVIEHMRSVDICTYYIRMCQSYYTYISLLSSTSIHKKYGQLHPKLKTFTQIHKYKHIYVNREKVEKQFDL